MGSTKIEWTQGPDGGRGMVWNPVTGCTRVDRGCAHCYAARMAPRLAGRCGYPADDPFRVTLHPDKLGEPLRWRKPRIVFVDSMGDLFHKDVPDVLIRAVFGVMAEAPRHMFIVLTKRPDRAAAWFADVEAEWQECRKSPSYCRTSTQSDLCIAEGFANGYNVPGLRVMMTTPAWPLQNVIIGTSVHDQRSADVRVPHLLRCPAACRVVSAEPLVGPLDLARWMPQCNAGTIASMGEGCGDCDPCIYTATHATLAWFIAGGESGTGAAPVHPQWIRSLRDQCAAAGVPFMFKQWGEWAPIGCGCGDPLEGQPVDHGATLWPDGRVEWVPDRGTCADGGVTCVEVGKHRAGRRLDGAVHDAYPDVCRRVR